MKHTKLESGLHALVWRESRLFVAKCVEIELASQGKSKDEAIKNLQEALELYFEDEKLTLPSLTNLELLAFPFRLGYA